MGNRIAWFVTPHGFGHAARSSAVMEALSQLDPGIGFEIFTKVPKWFFQDSLSRAFDYHFVLTDIGLVQKDPLHEDFDKTLEKLEAFFPFQEALIAELSEQVRDSGCALVVCDIAPMGIAVAKKAGIPSVLVENFTWDWIYEGYREQDKRMEPHIGYAKALFQSAEYHIRTEPVCVRGPADLTTPPISRKIKMSSRTIREQLGIARNAKAVLITMGGIEMRYGFLEKLEAYRGAVFVIPGASSSMETRNNLILLPHRSDFHHPDLVNACDAVIGKVGYGTVAEVWQAGVPFGYVPRPFFRESEKLAEFIEQEMSGIPIPDTEFENGDWLEKLDHLLSLPRIPRTSDNGADLAARFVRSIMTLPHQ